VSGPTALPPIRLELHNIGLEGDNRVWTRLRFEDGTELGLDFTADSNVAQELLRVVETGVNELLSTLGGRGIRISGFTPQGPDE